METGQREVDATRKELVEMLTRFESLRHSGEASKDELARAAGEIRALVRDLRAMKPSD